MGQAFYRKYRSKTLDEVIGQDHITTILKNVLKSGNLSHAYLFTGPRGVGKTSIARILAKSVNGIEADDADFYSDIIEIDAASNRRIEEIRELRDKIAIAPSLLKYKVYIIDEVHMLTREAFNALLKTLEEPPAHAIFILATTDFHKVPDTIVSRCMRLNFKALAVADLVAGLKDIVKKEKIETDEEAIEVIAEFSDGSFRDALSLLDQMHSTGKKIDIKLVELTLGIANRQSIAALIGFIVQSNAKEIFNHIQAMVDNGATPDQINKQLSLELRKSLIKNRSSNIPSQQAIDLIENLNKMYAYQDPKLALELAILKVINFSETTEVQLKADAIIGRHELEKSVSVEQKAPAAAARQKNKEYNSGVKLWQDALVKLKQQNNTLYGIARMAEPAVDDDQLILSFKFPFHLKQVTLQKNKSLLERVVSEIRSDLKLILILSGEEAKSIKQTINAPDKQAPDDIKSISNIFGSAEVLES